MIDRVKAFAGERGIGADRFEFQMLYDIRRDLQRQLLAERYRLRVYVPFGTEWWPYFMRRLARRARCERVVRRRLAHQSHVHEQAAECQRRRIPRAHARRDVTVAGSSGENYDHEGPSWSRLACPETGAALRAQTIAEVESRLPGRITLQAPRGQGYEPLGRTPQVLARETSDIAAYPVKDGIPVLLTPELLVPDGHDRQVNIFDPRYAEAYAEMAYYSRNAESEIHTIAESNLAQHLRTLLELSDASREAFPKPADRWLDATFELLAQWDAYRFIRPVPGTRVLQIGGRGTQGLRMLLAGAAETCLVTPMLGELAFGRALAGHCGVGDRFGAVAGIAEALPFEDGIFDIVYVQGSLHHTMVDLALRESHRVLRPGGKFAAVEPWRGPLYGFGTRLFGKRDQNVRCEVLTASRIEPHLGIFASANVVHHGLITRYALIALSKLGVRLGRRTMLRIAELDDAVVSHLPQLRHTGSSVAILATRATA